MLPASNCGPGMNLCFPDPCLTPVGPVPVPIPYPNMALNCTSAVVAARTFIGYMPSTTLASIKPMTIGDNAGVAHPLFMQMGGQTLCNPRFLTECMPQQHLCATAFGNMFNAPTGITAVPSISTTTSGDRSVSPSQLEGLRAALRGDAGTVSAAQLAPGIAYLRLERFTTDVSTRIYNALRGVDASAGLVLDLSGNPGGEVDAAFEVAGDFLPRGAVLSVCDDGSGTSPIVNRIEPSYLAPLCVLIDENSASAAELVAACLQHHRRATIIGRTSYGKTSGQRVCQEPDGTLRYRTVALHHAPDGSVVHGAGVRPDVVVEDSEQLLPVALAALAQA